MFHLLFCFSAAFLFIRRVKKFFSCATTTSGMTSPRPARIFKCLFYFFESSTALYNSRIPTVLKTSHKKGGQNILFRSTLNCCFSIVPPFCDTQINSNKAICTFSYFVFLFILSLCFETSQTIVFISPF